MVDIKKRVAVVDTYAEKLINSEYSLREARNVIIGGLKEYERLLSLSKDRNNPKWKPLHMAGSWNSRNRRMAKLRARDNWFKGSQEVEPPGSQKDGKPEDSSRGMEMESQERPPRVTEGWKC